MFSSAQPGRGMPGDTLEEEMSKSLTFVKEQVLPKPIHPIAHMSNGSSEGVIDLGQVGDSSDMADAMRMLSVLTSCQRVVFHIESWVTNLHDHPDKNEYERKLMTGAMAVHDLPDDLRRDALVVYGEEPGRALVWTYEITSGRTDLMVLFQTEVNHQPEKPLVDAVDMISNSPAPVDTKAVTAYSRFFPLLACNQRGHRPQDAVN